MYIDREIGNRINEQGGSSPDKEKSGNHSC